MNELAFFSGDGGGLLGGLLLGWRTVCAVEINARAASVLVARQNDGYLEPFPVWDDVRTFDPARWRGIIDVVSAGIPCTDISSARSNNKVNGKHFGLDGKDSGLWTEVKRVLPLLEYPHLFAENSPLLRTRGLVRILKDLAEMGYNAKWCCLGVRCFGADHIRERIFLVASHADKAQLEGGGISSGVYEEDSYARSSSWWKDKPGLERVANGMPDQMERLATIGNRQVPIVVTLAWRALNA